jgi:sucrose-6-phosphate hydrolase SacC (GH32 family)
MVMPRVLSITREGFLSQQPVAEFAQLRGAVTEVASVAIPPAGPVALDGVRGDALELEADLVMGNAAEMGFDLRCSTAGKAGISVRINRNGGLLSVGASRISIRRGLERYRLRIFLDKRVVEVYVNDGEAALFTTVDAGPQDLAVFAVSQAAPARGRGPGPAPVAPAAARIESLRSWPLKAATFTLDKFHA